MAPTNIIGPAADVKIIVHTILNAGRPRRDLNLDIDGAGFDALERHGGDALNHVAPACRQSTAGCVLERLATVRSPSREGCRWA
jgi:hypothetical protein